MKKKEMLESRGFRDEKHLKSWLEECTDKTLVAEVKAYFEIEDDMWVVTEEDDAIHVRPVVDGEILDTEVESVEDYTEEVTEEVTEKKDKKSEKKDKKNKK